MGRKFEGPHIGQNHMPTAALLHEAKLGEASLSTLLSLSSHFKTDQNKQTSQLSLEMQGDGYRGPGLQHCLHIFTETCYSATDIFFMDGSLDL